MYASIQKGAVTPIITSTAASDRLAQTDAGNLNSVFILFHCFYSFLSLKL